MFPLEFLCVFCGVWQLEPDPDPILCIFCTAYSIMLLQSCPDNIQPQTGASSFSVSGSIYPCLLYTSITLEKI